LASIIIVEFREAARAIATRRRFSPLALFHVAVAAVDGLEEAVPFPGPIKARAASKRLFTDDFILPYSQC
jgi:hypothetical protein